MRLAQPLLLLPVVALSVLVRSHRSAAFVFVANPTRSLLRRSHSLPFAASQGGDDAGNGETIDDTCLYDVAVIGSGPASCSLAALLTASDTVSAEGGGEIPSNPPRVVLLSKFAEKRWVPNYGCWTDEWAALDRLYAERGVPGLMERGVDLHWKDTDCFFGEFGDGVLANPDPGDSRAEGDHRRSVGREYLRVSRDGLKAVFYGTPPERGYEVVAEDVAGTAVGPNIYSPALSVAFHETFTELTLKESGRKIGARIVVDGTGAESPFTIREKRDREGYQIAYGVEARVKGAGVTATHVGDYDRSKMTLFDFRSEKWRRSLPDPDEVITLPTFNYVMPLSDDVVFFEETSLVANPAMSFRECQRRLRERLKSQDVEITDVLEEEFCYIPMGGGLPRRGQRIVPIGAASGLVHPSTGYQVGRALSSNLDVADQIVKELQRRDDGFDPDAASARILGRIWTKEAIRQRNFAVFGGEFFMTLGADRLREFFAGFFRLEPSMWGGFLAGWKNLPGYDDHKNWQGRLTFGLTALSKLPPKTALAMAADIFRYVVTDEWGVDLIQSVTPLAGEPEGYESSQEFRRPENQGDRAAKDEAMLLLCNCDRCEEAAVSETQIPAELNDKIVA